MSVFIRNPNVESAARELARLRGVSLTEAVGSAIEAALDVERTRPKRRPSISDMIAATDRFRAATGLDKSISKAGKADFDALWETDAQDRPA